MRDRSREGTTGDVVGLDGVDGALSAEAGLQAQREPSGRHYWGDGREVVVVVVVGCSWTAAQVQSEELRPGASVAPKSSGTSSIPEIAATPPQLDCNQRYRTDMLLNPSSMPRITPCIVPCMFAVASWSLSRPITGFLYHGSRI